jgi:hypothetical protein
MDTSFDLPCAHKRVPAEALTLAADRASTESRFVIPPVTIPRCVSLSTPKSKKPDGLAW